MPPASPEQVTLYLQEMERGDATALDRLLPFVYDDLRGLADRIFSDQWREQTLQPTALVHEAYMRLVKPENVGWENRRHFLRVAAIAMRQLITDYARKRQTEKRGGARACVMLQEPEEPSAEGSGIDLVALEEALTELQELDERQARIVELRFLTGLTVEETADVLGISERMVYLDWKMARTWLERRLAD